MRAGLVVRALVVGVLSSGLGLLGVIGFGAVAQTDSGSSASLPVTPTEAPPLLTATTVPDTLPPPAPVVAPTIPAPTSPVPTAVTTAVTTTTLAPVPIVGLAQSLVPVCRTAVGTPTTLPIGPLLGCRIVASYGNPLSTGMGILGRLPQAAMLADLAARTAAWQKADPARMHTCALELIAITVQASPGPSGLYRARMGAGLINKVVGWARGAGCIVILDMQVGWSSVAAELPYLEPWLAQPDVHLGLDPEWDMPPGVKPGTRIGTTDAADVNVAVDHLTKLVDDGKLPPKLLVVHRFRNFMVTNPAAIKTPPEIRLLVNMDGFGTPARKLDSYVVAQRDVPTSLTGFKLFTLIDKPILEPSDVLKLNPVPVFINYQ